MDDNYENDIKVGDSASTVSHASSTSSARIIAQAKKESLLAKLKRNKEKDELEIKLAERKIKCEQERKERYLKREQERKLLENLAEQEEKEILRNTELELKRLELSINNTEVQAQLDAAVAEEAVLSGCFTQHNISNARDTPDIPSVTPHKSLTNISQDSTMTALIGALTAPKVDLMTFDGNPINYWTFTRAFEVCVDNVMTDPGAKLARLLHYCVGNAKDVIRFCSVMEPQEGYTEALRTLKERFGNDYLIAETWINKLTDGPQLKPTDNIGLRRLADEVLNCERTLHAMNRTNEIDTNRSLMKIVSRLPYHLQNRWKSLAIRVLDDSSRYPNLTKLVEFLNKVAKEANDPILNNGNINVTQDKRSVNLNIQTLNDKAEHTSCKCSLCKSDHDVINCPKFLKMNPRERLNVAKDRKMCFNCLKINHRSGNCFKSGQCDKCDLKHSPKLHDSFKQFSKPESTNFACSQSKMTLLPIVTVNIQSNKSNNVIKTRALLDTGSDRTFCTKQLLKELSIEGSMTDLSVCTLNGRNTIAVEEVDLIATGTENCPRKSRRSINLPKVLAVEELPTFQPKLNQFDPKKWNHLCEIDSYKGEENLKVGLIIGQDVPEALMPIEIRRGTSSDPYAVRTALGWTFNGPINSESPSDTLVFFTQTQSDVNLENQVSKFWKIEKLAEDKETAMSVDDKKAVNIWESSIEQINGHYQLAIPFKENSELPDSKTSALNRLYGLKRKLSKDNALFERYSNEINQLVEKGYAEKVTDDTETGDIVWYLPHHNVVNPNKPEKTRVVFDCAAEIQGKSLNKSVLQGPDLLNKLLGVLIRFRQERYAVMGDIEAMFHQVKVSPKDRDALRFLWWKDNDMNSTIEEFRMSVHLFGGVWSPSCACYAIQRTALDNATSYAND